MSITAIGELEILGRLALAALLGGIVGLDRELRNYPAGLRTLTLVTVGATLFTEVSRLAGDDGRIAAQVVTGIGFLGAGVIFQHGVEVKGLTTAATIWAVAAVGLAVGRELYIVAPVATLGILLILESRVFTKGHEGLEGRIRAWLEKIAPALDRDVQETIDEHERERRGQVRARQDSTPGRTS
jgi:uncharacterized membrane protein YhiD involved in acid resistance